MTLITAFLRERSEITSHWSGLFSMKINIVIPLRRLCYEGKEEAIGNLRFKMWGDFFVVVLIFILCL